MDARERRALAEVLAAAHDGVVSRRELGDHGISRHYVRAEVAAGRWRTVGRQCVAIHTGDLSVLARRWQAVWETGAAIAAIDGVTALQHAGLAGFTDDRVHVSAVHNHNTAGIAGARIHKVIRRVSGELAGAGLPRTRPEVAAVRAAHWSVSNRQAALILLMTIQQRLTTPMRLAAAQRLVRGRTRRAFIRAVVRDIGRIYLDVRWDHTRLVVEIDGAQHRWGLAITNDNLRQNSVTLDGDRVLRMDVIGLRLETDLFMDQVERGLCPDDHISA